MRRPARNLREHLSVLGKSRETQQNARLRPENHIAERETRRHLFRLYDAGVPFIWSSYAAPFISVARIGPQSRAHANSSHFGAVMKDESQRDNGSPYSPLMCILLLLATGVAVKSGAATQLGQLAQSSCSGLFGKLFCSVAAFLIWLR